MAVGLGPCPGDVIVAEEAGYLFMGMGEAGGEPKTRRGGQAAAVDAGPRVDSNAGCSTQ
jgi:hypothetical protein